MTSPKTSSDEVLAAFRAFYAERFPPEPTTREDHERRLLALFRSAAEDVPAYRAFLAQHGVEPGKVAPRAFELGKRG